MNWSHRVILITGASSGIGRSLAVEFARRGAEVGLLAPEADALQKIVKQIRAFGGSALSLPADVTDAQALDDAVCTLGKEFGSVDVLVANAGISLIRDAAELNGKEVADLISVNVIGVSNSVAAVVPAMVKRGQGQLVAISSLAAYRGLPKSAAYCASKAAISVFFESLRVDLRDKGIAVTIIYPGFIKTPLTEGRQEHMPFLMELDEATIKIISAIEKKQKSYAFPWQLATAMRIATLIPISLYDPIVRKRFAFSD